MSEGRGLGQYFLTARWCAQLSSQCLIRRRGVLLFFFPKANQICTGSLKAYMASYNMVDSHKELKNLSYHQGKDTEKELEHGTNRGK